MQYNKLADGTLADLPNKNIDTGAGLERNLPMLQGVESLFETDVFRPVLAVAEEITAVRYGTDAHTDVSLRILADHARAMAMVVADGVMPSNEGRGYVLRRVIRRAVRRAFQLGVLEAVTPRLVGAVADVLGGAYPVLVQDLDRIQDTVEREEGAFRRTLDAGSVILEEALRDGTGKVSGATAFRLHDTHGFPIELTMEMAAEAGVEVDAEGFEREMAAQRELARADARRRRQALGEEAIYRELLARIGPDPLHRLRALRGALLGGGRAGGSGARHGRDRAGPHAVLRRVRRPGGRHRGHHHRDGAGPGPRHPERAARADRAPRPDRRRAVPRAGRAGGDRRGRREATRRHHTGTHLLHSALRQVLGDHVRQQGSLVAPDRLRFDFSHPKAPASPGAGRGRPGRQCRRPERRRRWRSSRRRRREAEALGALAFFEDKYGERVRVVRAGVHSTELCGGTHVDALGMMGPITIVSEGSIGSNTRRIEAVTGTSSLALLGESRRTVEEAARLLRVEPGGVLAGAAEGARSPARRRRRSCSACKGRACRRTRPVSPRSPRAVSSCTARTA